MKKILLHLSIGLVLLLFAGSCMNYHVQKGDAAYNNLAYADAIHHYEKAYRKNYDPIVELKLADAYFKTGKIDSAEALYARAAQNANVKASVLFNYSKVLMANGKHVIAAVYLREYLLVHPKDAVARMMLTACNSLMQRYRDTTLYTLTPIQNDEFINAFSVMEYQNGVVFTADKKVFSGRKMAAWTGNSYLDLYAMNKDVDGNWMSPELLKGDINGRFHEGPATFTSDGQTVYFTRSNYLKRRMEVNADHENNLKIFQATLIDGEWKNLVEFPYNSDDYSCGHPSLSADGQTMYFISDMPGGEGGTDIYASQLQDGVWSVPVNLGRTINTSGNEMFPFIHDDGALYFSSDAHNSMGGLDVFITYFNGKRWMQPENLNYPLNSPKDDFGFSLNRDNHSGFVSSSRTEKDQMFAFEKHAPKFNLYGTARLKGTITPVEGVIVEITNVKTGEIESVISDANGNFKLKLQPDMEYDLYCTKIGCFSRTDKISTLGLKYSEDFYANYEVEPIVIDKPIVLENIYYDFDKWEIRPDAALELDKLVQLLIDNPKIDIEMGSHTDARGSDHYNAVLSDKRAHAAVQYLISKGIDPARLTHQGYGESVPINSCKNNMDCTEELHQQNRRTEFKVKRINN
jgi:peptidoglycan-associated lipoprotein